MINYEIHIKINKMLPACINDLICVFFIANKNMIYCFQGAKGTIAGQEGITRSTFTCFVDFCQCLNFVIVCNWYL